MEDWSDTVVMFYLLQNRLEALGYEVEEETLTDAAVTFAALDGGDIDLHASAWPDVTHKEYWDEYGENLEDIVAYNSSATNMLAVPSYTDIDSIDQLLDDPARFGNQIVGIEPGAGLTAMVEDSVIPGYGLDSDFEFLTSSTAAMLSELQSATDAEEDIVVTLWRPYWGYQENDVKPLEDPEGAFGEPESMHVLGRSGFGEDFADAAEYIAQIELADEPYESLENLVINEYEDDPAAGVEAWIEENPDLLPEIPES